MFHMLSQNPELAPESSTKPSRLTSRKPSIDLGQAGVHEPPVQRKKLQLLPRSKPTAEENTPASVLSQFGKINKSAPMVVVPSSVFAGGKNDVECESLSRTSSRSNMFHMLSQNPELMPEASTKHGLPTSGKLSLDYGQTDTKLSMWKTFDQNPEALVLRKKLDPLPRFKPSVVETQRGIKRGKGKHIETFFALRDPEEAGV